MMGAAVTNSRLHHSPPPRRRLSIERIATRPHVWHVPDFATESEISHLMSLTHTNAAKARGVRWKHDATGFSL